MSDGYHSRVVGFTSLAVLIGALGVWVGVPVLDPTIGLAITVTVLFIVRDAAGREIGGRVQALLGDAEHGTNVYFAELVAQ
jgi:divalent metal cation (Fe/Co/Zn/Cd) transporter